MPADKTGPAEREILRGVLYIIMLASLLGWCSSLQITPASLELTSLMFFSFLISLAALAVSARPRS